MSKAFNRAQAKAWRDEKRSLEHDEQHKKNVREELAVLRDFRNYMERRPTQTTIGCLLAAVDAYVEQLTGNKHALWAGSRDYRHWWDE